MFTNACHKVKDENSAFFYGVEMDLIQTLIEK